VTQWGWGLAASSTGDVPVQWWRWSHPESDLYNLRPDRLAVNLVNAIEYSRAHRGVGGPSVSTPISTVSSKSRQEGASADLGKSGRTPSPSVGKESRARRKSCPQGHYWSYKEKKCVKSKFR